MTQLPQPDSAFDALIASAVRRLLHGEALEPFCDWFAREMADLVMAPFPLPAGEEDAARRYRRSIARAFWAALPVPVNRWRPRTLPKVERNDPCHCGSGRKFKQCCAEFAGVAPPIESDSLYALALAQAEPAMLTADRIRLVPAEALGMAAMDWNDRGEPERTVTVLAPLFQQRNDLDGRYEIAFDALVDAMQALGQETQRVALAQHVSQSRDKALATAARCRHASILADQGEFDAAWAMFQSAQRLDPGNSQLWHLELTLLLAQGRDDEARLRAPVLAAKARKAGMDELASVLLQLGEGGFAGAYQRGNIEDVDDPDDRAWIALCEQTPSQFEPQHCLALYRIGETASRGAGQPPILSVKAAKPLADLQRRWRRRFPVDKPVLTRLQGDADALLGQLPAAAQFLKQHPQAWLSMEVLDDLLLAAAELCDWETPGPVVRAARRLSRHALAVLQVLTGTADGERVQLDWADADARSMLRPLAQAIDLARLVQDRKEEEELLRRGLALNPDDNHGWRGLLVPLYFARGAFEKALALIDRYPDDLPPMEHNRALALFALGRRAEAEAVLRRAHEAYSAFVSTMLPDVVDRPPDEAGPGLRVGGAMAAFYYRSDTRAAWVSTGALAWAKALDLPQPAPGKTRKPTAAKRTARPGKAGTSGGGKGASVGGAFVFGATQKSRLRKIFPNYPRLHGLLTSIAWSPEIIMPVKWLEIAMAMRGEPVSGLTEGKALTTVNAELDALMRLFNSLNNAVLQTPPDQGPPLKDVLALTVSDQTVFEWAAGFVQGAELAVGGWRRAGRPVSGGKGVFAELYSLAARAHAAPEAWRARTNSGQPLLLGLDDEASRPVEKLTLALADLWRVISHARQGPARGG